MNPAHLQTLSAILDEGSFEGAALRLGISTSAVSQRIKTLEKDLGRIVLRRTTPISATEAGEVIVQAARRMALLQAETEVQLRQRFAEVALNVAINADSLATWFPPIFSQVAQRTGTTLNMVIEDEAHSLKLLKRGDVLGAITNTADAVSGCESEYLGKMRYRAVAAPQLIAQYQRSSREDVVEQVPCGTANNVDYAKMPVLRFSPRDELQRLSLERHLGGAIPRGIPVHQIPSSEGFMQATIAGLGWALLPESQALPLLECGSLVELDNQQFEVALYWHHWRLESPSLEWLTKQVKQAATAGLER